MTNCEVAIIGAGPYGLSIASHLNAEGINTRIFGNPMQTWRENMPRGMHLKSDGFASSLYDPRDTFSLASYCKDKGIPYADSGLPVALETFTSYGMEFQKRFVPQLEQKRVVSVERRGADFLIGLDDGEEFSARKVVVAAGLSHFSHLPEVFAKLPEEFVTHSSRHHALDSFKGKAVAVIGAGASAADVAALLHQAGAKVQMIARQPVIRFHDPPNEKKPSLKERLLMPATGIGGGWRVYLCANAPLLFRQMPEKFRLQKVRAILGPAPGWFIKEQLVGKVPFTLGVTITDAKVENGQVTMDLIDRDGKRSVAAADHVIAATGYKVDLRRLTFLNRSLLAEIRTVEQTPVLSSSFESSVNGLYFVGTAAANTFGPLLRFAFGARFTTKRITRHLSKAASRKRVQQPVFQPSIPGNGYNQ